MVNEVRASDHDPMLLIHKEPINSLQLVGGDLDDEVVTWTEMGVYWRSVKIDLKLDLDTIC
jgi:hypothetical protein